jgi:hypothetical protein
VSNKSGYKSKLPSTVIQTRESTYWNELSESDMYQSLSRTGEPQRSEKNMLTGEEIENI